MKTEDAARAQIVAYAAGKFFVSGYSKVSTEELASGLGMSKSTLYKYFSSKEELLTAVIRSFYDSQASIIEEISGNREVSIDKKIGSFLQMIGSRLSMIRKEALADLKRTVPDIYAYTMGLRQQIIVEKLTQLIREGIRAGFFRDDMEPEFIVGVLLAAIEAQTDPERLTHSADSYETAVRRVFALILEGGLSKRGRERYEAE